MTLQPEPPHVSAQAPAMQQAMDAAQAWMDARA
jgi:hypothetical protein